MDVRGPSDGSLRYVLLVRLMTFGTYLLRCGLGLGVSISRPSRDVVTSGFGSLTINYRLVETFRAGAPYITSVLQYCYKPVCFSP